MADPRCRSCGAPLTRTLVDLGEQPLANAYLTQDELRAGGERSYPLHARVCDRCLLVQVDDVVPAEAIFSDYAYFSSYSESWVEHSRRYAKHAIDRLGLDHTSLVVEVASNDGYLLRHFVDAGIEVLGIEPAANVAEVAVAAGVPTEVRFFGVECAADVVAQRRAADLVVANNVLAHVPDLDDFVRGLALLLAPHGVLTIEVPHLLRMLQRVEFDTIYHEHFSYFSLLAASRALADRGLRIFDVDELTTHGGSLRLWVGHDAAAVPVGEAVRAVLAEERAAGLDGPAPYEAFSARVDHARSSLRRFLAGTRAEGKRVAAYGAAAKGNTLLNSCGVGTEHVEYVVDRSPHKQGLFLPGSHLPIRDPDFVRRDRPDYLLILPWNLRDEITEQMADVRGWGCRFVVAIPEIEILPVIFHELAVEGAYLLEPERIVDERGWFARTLDTDELAERELVNGVVQISLSHNARRGTLRGMHVQLPPHEETKVVRCTRGAVHDVIVDLRHDSRTFGRWAAAELSSDNGHAVYVPRSCAHGFLTLEDDTDVEYVISAPYTPDAASGVRFDDPAFAIEWPFRPTVINERDRSYPSVDLDNLRSE